MTLDSTLTVRCSIFNPEPRRTSSSSDRAQFEKQQRAAGRRTTDVETKRFVRRHRSTLAKFGVDINMPMDEQRAVENSEAMTKAKDELRRCVRW